MDFSLLGSSVHGILQARVLEWITFPFSPRDLPNPGIEPRFPALRADSLSSEPPGKPQHIGVGSLSLLQRTFLTQESNSGLLHCRHILYKLRFQGSPLVITISRDRDGYKFVTFSSLSIHPLMDT